jgi:hypothetical protein
MLLYSVWLIMPVILLNCHEERVEHQWVLLSTFGKSLVLNFDHSLFSLICLQEHCMHCLTAENISNIFSI